MDDAHIPELRQAFVMAHYHHGNLEESLLSEGAIELDRVGPINLSLRNVAKKAGVSHNAPYRHFKDKEALIFAICDKSARQIADQIERAPLLYPASCLFQCQYIGRLFVEFAAKHPARANLLFGGFVKEPSVQNENRRGHLFQNILFAIESVLAQNKDQGLLLDNPPLLNLTLFSALRGYALMVATLPMPQAEDDETFDRTDQIVQNILLGLLP